MTSCGDVFSFLCELAPTELQMDFDNAGFLIGRKSAEVTEILVALDVTDAVVEEAIESGAQLIVSHHPVIFRAIKSITDEKLLKLIENRIAVISMHTNLDIAEGGVNDVLLALLGAEREDTLDEAKCGRVGVLPMALSMADFLKLCRDRLHTNGLRYYDASRPVRRIAVLGGAGADELLAAASKGCDTYVTSDIGYHEFLLAAELGINLIDGDHFGTEDPVIPVLREKLAKHFPELSVKVSETHKALISFY